jgi:hypothetical protein
MFISVSRGYAFQRRPETGGLSDSTSGGSGSAPGWVRLKRSGTLFTAYTSTDGQTWQVVGSDNIPMADAAYVGIAVTSHNTTATTRAGVDNLSITQAQTQATANQPPTVSLTTPANGTSYTAPATITLTASASDPEGQLAKVEFYAGSTLLGTDTGSPYTFTWSSVPAGSYTLTAVAYDGAGAKTTSAPITVAVTTATTPPRAVTFQASADHATLVNYRLDVFASNANPATATPIASVNLGKPTPDSTGLITSDQSAFFTALAVGNYLATVSAIGTSGESRSASVAFSR